MPSDWCVCVYLNKFTTFMHENRTHSLLWRKLDSSVIIIDIFGWNQKLLGMFDIQNVQICPWGSLNRMLQSVRTECKSKLNTISVLSPFFQSGEGVRGCNFNSIPNMYSCIIHLPHPDSLKLQLHEKCFSLSTWLIRSKAFWS